MEDKNETVYIIPLSNKPVKVIFNSPTTWQLKSIDENEATFTRKLTEEEKQAFIELIQSTKNT